MTETVATARVTTITPAIAKELLARNKRNRKVSDRNYQVVLRSIIRNEWKLNGEAIKIDRNGYVLDGQHRLHAIVESETPIETFIIEGLDPDTQDTMDTGKSRTVADVLQIRGEKNTHTLASIIRRIYIYEAHGIKAATSASYPTTNREVLAFYEQNPWIESLVHEARRVGLYAKMPSSLAGLLIHAFTKVDAADAAFFFDKLVTGENLDSLSPIYALRRALQTIHDNPRGTKGQAYLAAISIKAFNKFRAGESVGTLKFTPGGANPEKFPIPA